jgi:phosphate transport system substrate-binding protein
METKGNHQDANNGVKAAGKSGLSTRFASQADKSGINQLAQISKLQFICCLFILGFLTLSFQSANAQAKKSEINIYGTKFTYPLIEKWIAEYGKLQPGVQIHLISNRTKTDSITVKVYAHTLERSEIRENENEATVGRFALLPVTNDRNAIFQKQFKKGFKPENLKDIFLKKGENWDLDPRDAKNEPKYTVYNKNAQSCISIALANYFGRPASELKGKNINGDEKYLLSAVLRDSTGITFGSLSNIYDQGNRSPIKGIKVLPIDLNNTGKLDIYGNLDNLLSYLEVAQNKDIPTDYVNFVYNAKNQNPDLEDFIAWIQSKGQDYNHQYGFLNYTRNANTSQK